jgi:ribosome maturation factor RimP
LVLGSESKDTALKPQAQNLNTVMVESEIANLVNEHLAGTDKFLVEVLIKPANRIYVFIDGDHGVTISDCADLSRFIESHFDRETTDFELNVSSSGADQPIRMPRQYMKDIGRSLQVRLQDENVITGILESYDESNIILVIKEDKKKKIPPATVKIAFDQIKESKVIISFK